MAPLRPKGVSENLRWLDVNVLSATLPEMTGSTTEELRPAAGWHTRASARPSPRSTRRGDAASWSGRRRSTGARGRRGRRVHAGQVDLLPSQGRRPASSSTRSTDDRRCDRRGRPRTAHDDDGNGRRRRRRWPSDAGRPIRKDERIVADRGLYIESWLPERRSRRKPLYLLHGELGGSWLWQRYLGYFAPRGWEGHALNLRGHYWSETADFAELDFDTYIEDALAGADVMPRPPIVLGHGLGGLLALRSPASGPSRHSS